MNVRQEAFTNCIPFNKSELYLSAHGNMLDDYLLYLEHSTRKFLDNVERKHLSEYLTLLKTIRHLEAQYYFYSGWDAARKEGRG